MAGVSIVERYLKSLKEEKTLLFITISLAMIFYFMTLSLNSTYDDNLSYLNIGKEFAETGNYTGNFWNRPPVIPFTVSVLYSLGLDLIIITIFLPLAFLILFLLANFFFFRTLYGREIAFLVTWSIMALPSFWRWSERLLVDTPFGGFALLSILFFYIGMEKDRKYLIFSSFFFALSFLTKTSGVILIPIFLIYFLYRRSWSVVRTKEFVISLIIGIFIPSIVMLSLFVLDASLFSTDTLYFAAVPQGQGLMMKFFLNPLFVFFPLGVLRIVKERRRENVLILITILLFIGVLSQMIILMRYLTVIYGFIFFLSVYGMMLLRRRGKWNLVFILFIITGLSVGLVNSAYVLGIDSNTRFGVRDLASFVEEDVDDNKRIAGGNLGGYLVTYTSKDVVSFPYHIEIGNEVVTIQEYYNIVTDPHNELHERYILLARGGRIKDYYYFDTNWVEENNISYIVWSIYDEFLIAPKEDYYNIIYAGIELPIKRPYISMRPPPDYEFSSDIYIHLETSGKYKKVKEFHKEGQKIIVIYRFDGQ